MDRAIPQMKLPSGKTKATSAVRFISQLRERPDLRHDKRERERLLTVQQSAPVLPVYLTDIGQRPLKRTINKAQTNDTNHLQMKQTS